MKSFSLILIFVFTFIFSFQSHALPVDIHGYLRSGLGNNLHSGKQNCFKNPGSEGNEFRLGNECGIYGETTFLLEFLEKSENNSSFKTQTTLAFFPNANTQYGDETSQNDVDIVEAFVEAKNIEGIPYTYWVGKRFYRDTDLHMNDFYYFAAMNGVGAGVKDISLLSGKFAVAYLQETMTSTTTSDQLVKSFLDFRLQVVQVEKLGELNFWTSIASAPKGTIGSTDYEKVDGQAFGVRLRNQLSEGFNDFALVYGRNLMSSLTVYGNGEIAANTSNSKRFKLRAVEHITKKVSDKIELHAASTIELRNSGRSDSTWWNIGVRPMYLIKDNLHFVTQIGHSQVISNTSTLTLTRLTLAYEIALSKSIWARPVLRAYVTETVWNKQNQINFDGKSEGHALGFQAEAWF